MSRRMGLLGGLVTTAVLLGMACSPETGPSVEFSTPVADASGAIASAAGSNLGIVRGSDVIAMENGARIAIGEGKVAEVFLAPYPPDWNTDLHLFLMNDETFDPLTDVDVDLTYDMVFMNHGIDALTGSAVGVGHYVLPLSFLMYGDWNVNIAIDMEEAQKQLVFVVKFQP